MPDAVIVDVVRTPIGRAFKGSLAGVRAEDLGAFALKTLMDKFPNLDWSAEVEDFMLGCAFGEGETGYNVARQVGLLAGLPVEVGATTVNRFCASSLQTIRMAAHAIQAGEGTAFIAGGLEAVSRASSGGNFQFHPKLSGEGAIYDAYIPMGNTAENVAEKFSVSREDMDVYAKRSQDLAVESQENGFFDRELTPFTLEDGTVVSKDDGPRAGTTLEKLATLPTPFKEDGTVTAGNACPLNDGAAAALVMSADRANELGLKPRAKIIASSVSGIEPEIMGVGPIVAIQRVLDRAGMTINDIDTVELNEAFAAQVIPIMDAHNIPLDKMNPHGGAIALGHPFGMTGARIMATLLNGLETDDKQIGLETMCVGGGQGMAMIVERLN
ncbi:MAG TPA: acetyl-CoA C-acyltransferase [Solirubrobacterales bacterium]|jgi:acetyl-CoA C-acetyltransferase|nr:acetyl-CoA C-acyltransferase [Solirubrobacterales bacterium]